MVAAIVVTVFLGFAPTYYLRPSNAAPLPVITHVHAVAFSLWIVLLAAQVWLVAGGRRNVHRRLGVAGAALAAAMIGLGWMVAIATARREVAAGNGDEALGFLIIPLGDVVMFAGLVSAAVWYRTRPELHRRLMLLATLAILPAAIGRIPGFDHPALFVPYFLALLAAAPIHEWRTRGRPHPLSLWAGLFVFASELGRFMVQEAGWWRALAARLV